MRDLMRIRKSYVVIRFTRPQLEALSRALGATMNYPDVVEDVFPHGRDLNRAYEAKRLVETACHEARKLEGGGT